MSAPREAALPVQTPVTLTVGALPARCAVPQPAVNTPHSTIATTIARLIRALSAQLTRPERRPVLDLRPIARQGIRTTITEPQKREHDVANGVRDSIAERRDLALGDFPHRGECRRRGSLARPHAEEHTRVHLDQVAADEHGQENESAWVDASCVRAVVTVECGSESGRSASAARLSAPLPETHAKNHRRRQPGLARGWSLDRRSVPRVLALR